jgi:hypothetical protein
VFRVTRRDEPPDPPDDDTHFKESLARLTAQLVARNPKAAAGVPPLRTPAKPAPSKPPGPRDVIREVVRESAPEPTVARRPPPNPPPPSAPPPAPPRPSRVAPTMRAPVSPPAPPPVPPLQLTPQMEGTSLTQVLSQRSVQQNESTAQSCAEQLSQLASSRPPVVHSSWLHEPVPPDPPPPPPVPVCPSHAPVVVLHVALVHVSQRAAPMPH